MSTTGFLGNWGMFTESADMIVDGTFQTTKPQVGESWDDYWTRFQKVVREWGRVDEVEVGEVEDTAVREMVYCATDNEGEWVPSQKRHSMVYIG